MSYYSEVQVEFQSVTSLLAALLRVSDPLLNRALNQNELTVHLDDTKANRAMLTKIQKRYPQVQVSMTGASSLQGYGGGRRKAHVIIPRRVVRGLTNDIGFFMGEDKSAAIISDDDRKHFKNAQWQNEMKQQYGLEQAKDKCRLEGWTFQEKKLKNGNIQLEIAV